MEIDPNAKHAHVPWNKGKLTGQKPPLKLKEIFGNPHPPAIVPENSGVGAV